MARQSPPMNGERHPRTLVFGLKSITRAICFGARSLLIILALTLASGCSHGSEQQGFGARSAVPVLAAKAEEKTVANALHAIGRVEAYSTVNVKSMVGGQITEVHFKQGDEVKQGDLLFTIDPRPYEAALLQAEATLKRDAALAVRADADEKRYAYLAKQGVGSRQQYDQAHADAAAADALVAADQAAVETAKLNLAYTSIRSPLDGRTGDLLVHAGNVIKANEDNPMVVINQVRPVYVDFSIPEQNLPDVREYVAERKLPVEAVIPGQQQHVERGELTFIDNTVDRTTGTINLKGTFTNQDAKLWPGEFVNTTLVLNELPNTIVVPSQAIQTGQDGSYVFVINSAMKAETRPVVIGQSIDGETVVERGLKAGEMVVTDGQLRLIPGATVAIKHGLTGGAES
jgi:membrane fusion protein, multidrug efflux system